MKHKDKKYQEMMQAAREAGVADPTDSESAELERLWSELDSVLEPPHSDRPALSFKRIDGFGTSGPSFISRLHTFPVWAITAGIAAVLAFGFLVVQSARMHTALTQMESQVYHLESSLILASLRSDSAVDRMDGLLKLAGGDYTNPSIMRAVVDRLEYDPNSNIRLASVRTLARHAENPEVRETLESVARVEESPLVVMEILEILWAHDPQRAERLWTEIREDGRFAGILGTEPPSESHPSTTNL